MANENINKPINNPITITAGDWSKEKKEAGFDAKTGLKDALPAFDAALKKIDWSFGYKSANDPKIIKLIQTKAIGKAKAEVDAKWKSEKSNLLKLLEKINKARNEANIVACTDKAKYKAVKKLLDDLYREIGEAMKQINAYVPRTGLHVMDIASDTQAGETKEYKERVFEAMDKLSDINVVSTNAKLVTETYEVLTLLHNKIRDYHVGLNASKSFAPKYVELIKANFNAGSPCEQTRTIIAKLAGNLAKNAIQQDKYIKDFKLTITTLSSSMEKLRTVIKKNDP